MGSLDHMPADRRAIIDTSSWRPFVSGGRGLGSAEITALSLDMGHPLPEHYGQILAATNGLIFDDGLAIYGASDLREMNDIIAIAEHLPGYVTIGNDSGGREIVTPYHGGNVFWLDQGYVAAEGLTLLCESFSAWLQSGLPLKPKQVNQTRL